jgi:hypothetical protein
MVGFNCACGGHEREWQVPLTDLRHYDRSVMDVMELLRHADEEGNWEARRGVNIEDMARMGIEVAQVVQRRSREMLKEEAERNKARRRARKLLQQNLSPKEWQEFLKKKVFHVTGSDGRRYRISHQIGSNVTLVVGGKDAARYCLVPKGAAWIPEPDMMLAVKLMLETNARGFLRRANMTDLRPQLRRTG